MEDSTVEVLASEPSVSLVDVRKWKRTDIPFITSSWLNSFRDGAFVRGIPHTTYFAKHRKVIVDLLKRAFIIVLCAEDAPDTIVGWVCAEKTTEGALIVHYVYIKKNFRGMGFGRRLVEMLIEHETPVAVFYSHKTFFVKDYRDRARAEKRPNAMDGWIYDPYQMFANLSRTWDDGPAITLG